MPRPECHHAQHRCGPRRGHHRARVRLFFRGLLGRDGARFLAGAFAFEGGRGRDADLLPEAVRDRDRDADLPPPAAPSPPAFSTSIARSMSLSRPCSLAAAQDFAAFLKSSVHTAGAFPPRWYLKASPKNLLYPEILRGFFEAVRVLPFFDAEGATGGSPDTRERETLEADGAPPPKGTSGSSKLNHAFNTSDAPPPPPPPPQDGAPAPPCMKSSASMKLWYAVVVRYKWVGCPPDEKYGPCVRLFLGGWSPHLIRQQRIHGWSHPSEGRDHRAGVGTWAGWVSQNHGGETQ